MILHVHRHVVNSRGIHVDVSESELLERLAAGLRRSMYHIGNVLDKHCVLEPAEACACEVIFIAVRLSLTESTSGDIARPAMLRKYSCS